MAWWNWVVSPLAAAMGWGKDEKKEDPYAGLISAIKPILDQQLATSKELSGFGAADIGVARNQTNDLIKYFSNIMNGSRDEVLKNEDLSGITSDYDNAEKLLMNFAPRGGRRAQTLANIPFDKAATINKLVQQLRKEAPDKLAQLAQMMAQLGLSEYGIATGQGQQFVDNQFGVQDRRDAKEEAEANRQAAIISSILGAAGSAAGTLAGGR